MKRTILSILLILALLALIAGGCSRPNSNAEEAEVKVPVEVMSVELGEVVQSLDYNGDIKAEYEVKVFSKIPDRIEKLYVDVGDEVKKGAPVANILATTIEQAVRQVEAGLVAAPGHPEILLVPSLSSLSVPIVAEGGPLILNRLGQHLANSVIETLDLVSG